MLSGYHIVFDKMAAICRDFRSRLLFRCAHYSGSISPKATFAIRRKFNWKFCLKTKPQISMDFAPRYFFAAKSCEIVGQKYIPVDDRAQITYDKSTPDTPLIASVLYSVHISTNFCHQLPYLFTTTVHLRQKYF